MSTAIAEPVPQKPPRVLAGRFLLSRLGSLFAILPLGVWTLFHLWNNLAAYAGPGPWQTEVTSHGSAASEAAVAFFVLFPLGWHTCWGISRMFKSRPDSKLLWYSNIRYWVQRLAALGLLGFLGAHLYLAWFAPRIIEGHAESFRDISAHMYHHTPTTIVYALGILAVAYHLANGLWSFAFGWGLAVSRDSQRWMEWISLALFFVFLAIGWSAEYGLYRAGSHFPAPFN